jgi:adenylate cyclase
MSLFNELKRRNVIRMAGLYLVGAWLIAQVSETLLPIFHTPDWVLQTIVIMLAIGFLPALAFAWVFELTPDGIKRDDQVDRARSLAPQTGQRMNRLIIVVLLLALGYFGFDKFVLTPRGDAASSAVVEKGATQPASAASVANEVDASIAVLPFVNMSSDKEQEYFSDGLSEELLNQLAQIPQLRVIARTSSFSFKDKDVDVATIAKALGVAHVLEGSVRKSGNTLRITAQLIRTADSSHLWSQTYDRDMSDVFKVQDEISSEVVAALKVKLLPQQKLPAAQRTTNVEAYEQYLLGLDALRNTNLETAQAISAFQKAIALDPNYANAYTGLAWAQSRQAELADSPEERAAMIGEALASADRAIVLAPDRATGYSTRGGLRFSRGYEWSAADADLQTAYRLDPQNLGMLGNYSYYLLATGRVADALAASRRAVTIDPLNIGAWSNLGLILYYTGQIEQARAALEHALTIKPNDNWPNYLLGYLDAKAGDTTSALTHFDRIDGGFRLTGMAMVEHRLGHAAASDRALDELKQKYAAGFAFQIACVYAWRGETDQAFKWLNTAYETNDAGMVRLRFDPMLASLRGDPRFAALVKKMNFPE